MDSECDEQHGGGPRARELPQERHGIGDAKLAYNVVMRLIDGLWNVGHYVTMDNFFSNIGLFRMLLLRGIYACGTIRANSVGLPSYLKNTSAFKNVVQWTTFWRMHDTCNISCVIWKDKKPVLLLSTHAMPIKAPCEKVVVSVPRCNGTVRKLIQTSSVLKEYTTHMRGVDVADQLHASYNC